MPPIPKSRPILCYVTDRHALGPSASLPETIRQACASGVDWIQIREKDLSARELVGIVRSAVVQTYQTTTQIMVNDRFDVAIAAQGAGVHLGETALPVQQVTAWRRSHPDVQFRIGASCHSVESARAAERNGADYIFLGPVFATPSKAAFGVPLGVDVLAEACQAINLPVLAIGGVTIENARSCLSAGATGIAAIRLFQQSKDMATLIAGLRAAAA